MPEIEGRREILKLKRLCEFRRSEEFEPDLDAHALVRASCLANPGVRTTDLDEAMDCFSNEYLQMPEGL